MPVTYLDEPPPMRGNQRRSGLIFLVIIVLAILFSSRFIASTLIDYAWWSEMGQVSTWYGLLLYGTVPIALATLLLWVVFFTAFKLASRHTPDRPLFGFLKPKLISRLVLAASFFVALLAASATVDSWTVVRYVGGLRLPPQAGEYADPIFGNPLHFYFFALPFFHLLLHVLLIGTIGAILIYGIILNAHGLTSLMPRVGAAALNFDFETPNFRRTLDSTFIRVAMGVALLGWAAKLFLNRYDLLFDDHGAFLVGIDWGADHIVLPLQWLLIGGCLLAAAMVVAGRGRIALVLLLLLPVRFILPPIFNALYVRPNELTLERPYIQHHIDATRAAYGLNHKVKEGTLAADPEIPISYEKHKALLSNVRLWDWHAFHDTISQIQPLRPYSYLDTDVDRYTIDGDVRQVLLSARELDTRQLGDSTSHWINPHLMYTHGYGMVMAEANRITPDGLPQLFIKNAPPEVMAHSLKFTQPDIYYGEIAHEPVYVNTSQQEFDYPAGSQSVYTHYKGTGGFQLDSPLMRLAAAVNYGDLNILLTSYLTPQSRMMIHRSILGRLSTLAGFLKWDSDPYIVLAADGRLVWMVDGYMTSDAHPYSRSMEFGDADVNYIRNSVKATVDAYTGAVNLYVFDPADPLISAYMRLFPSLFKPMGAMPADIRGHARYPETLFNAQADIYRAFHMRDPEAFYNRADLWDIAKTGVRQADSPPSTASPTYVVASLPNEDSAEFLLLTPFTPANKDNLIGLMVARCDGDHLGELVFEQLSKQNIIFGPMQIDARINQDEVISKDLTLWNQQGSQVLRGQTLVLPISNSFLYVETIYIQSSQASMPQLKKVALAMGNQLAYADTYEQALAQLVAKLTGNAAAAAEVPHGAPSATTTSGPVPTPDAIQKLQQIRDHLTRYRELSSQGKWAEAGKELDAIQSVAQH